MAVKNSIYNGLEALHPALTNSPTPPETMTPKKANREAERRLKASMRRRKNGGRRAIQDAEVHGRLHTTESVLAIVGPQHVAFRQKMLGLRARWRGRYRR
jgi:hypothetical protein